MTDDPMQRLVRIIRSRIAETERTLRVVHDPSSQERYYTGRLHALRDLLDFMPGECEVPPPGWEDRAVDAARAAGVLGDPIGYASRAAAEDAARSYGTSLLVYRLDDDSWAPGHSAWTDDDGGHHHRATLRDGRLVQIEPGQAPGRWRVQDR